MNTVDLYGMDDTSGKNSPSMKDTVRKVIGQFGYKNLFGIRMEGNAHVILDLITSQGVNTVMPWAFVHSNVYHLLLASLGVIRLKKCNKNKKPRLAQDRMCTWYLLGTMDSISAIDSAMRQRSQTDLSWQGISEVV